jgi:hypothetical protein
MIRKSGRRFSEKIMLHQDAGATDRFNLKRLRSSQAVTPHHLSETGALDADHTRDNHGTVAQFESVLDYLARRNDNSTSSIKLQRRQIAASPFSSRSGPR